MNLFDHPFNMYDHFDICVDKEICLGEFQGYRVYQVTCGNHSWDYVLIDNQDSYTEITEFIYDGSKVIKWKYQLSYSLDEELDYLDKGKVVLGMVECQLDKLDQILNHFKDTPKNKTSCLEASEEVIHSFYYKPFEVKMGEYEGAKFCFFNASKHDAQGLQEIFDRKVYTAKTGNPFIVCCNFEDYKLVYKDKKWELIRCMNVPSCSQGKF